MKRIGDLGKDFCGLSIWQDGPASLPSGLTCPTPESPFQAVRSLKNASETNSRIVGGNDVDRATTWPWIVDLDFCGGSIVSKNPSGESDWILTGDFISTLRFLSQF